MEEEQIQNQELLSRLSILFRQAYEFKDFTRADDPAVLVCPHANECRFDPTRQFSMTPGLVSLSGDKSIMIVMESPYLPKSPGVKIGGDVSSWGEHNPYSELFDLVRKAFPEHFIVATDVVKCGVSSIFDKSILASRRDHCLGLLLSNEISILNPELILCAGGHAFAEVQNLQRTRVISPTIPICPLVHPSRRVFMSRAKKMARWVDQLRAAASRIGEAP